MRADSIIEEDGQRVLAACGPALAGIAGKTLLVTGATGFVGGSIVDALMAFNARAPSPCTVWLVTRSMENARRLRPDLAHAPHVRWLEWPLTSRESDTPGKCELVIHAAAPVGAAMAGKPPAAEEMVDLASQVIEWARRHGTEAMLLLSSGAVYGTPPREIEAIPESYAGGPADAYGEAKRRCELLFSRSGMPNTAARLFACFGPRQSLEAGFAVPDFFRQARDSGRIRIASDGMALRAYCYVTDAVSVLLKLLVRGEAGPRACNVGADAPVVSILELAKQVARAWGGAEVGVEGAGKDTARPRYVPDVSLMNTLHRAQVPLEEGLRRTAQSIRARDGARNSALASRA